MVKERISEDKTYYCDKCGWPYGTRESAEACEAKEPERIYINGPGEEWKPGDIAFQDISCGKNSGYRLIRIDHEYESKHYIRPFWVPADGLGSLPIRERGEYEEDDDWMNYTPMHMISIGAHILDSKRREDLIQIGKILEGIKE